MALNEKCDLCQKAVDKYTIEVDFYEITKQAYDDARKNAEIVKNEDEVTKTMWIFPRCKVYMKQDQTVCSK